MVEFLGPEFVDFLALGEFAGGGEGWCGLGFFDVVGFLLGRFQFTPTLDEGADLFAYRGGVGEFLGLGLGVEFL